ARAIELELVEAVVAQQLQRPRVKERVVPRPGQGKTLIVDLVPALLRGGQPLESWLAVPAPGRKPRADAGTEVLCRRAQRRKAVREVLAELPQVRVIVPAVVEQEGVHLHAASAHQLLTEGVNGVQRVALRVGREIADVVPGVVVQEGTKRRGTLTFQIRPETAAQ